jgi:hypothetical protein
VFGLTIVCDREAMIHNRVEKPQEKIKDIYHMALVESSV